MLRLSFLVYVMAISSIAHHDPRCNPADVQVCVDSELDQSNRLNLVCVDSRAERPLTTNVVWHKDGALHTDSTRIYRQRERLIFKEVLVSDEGNWTCSNGSLSPTFKLYAGKVNFNPELASLNRSIGDSFFIPCNIEVGINTAQTNYILNIERSIFYPDRSTSAPLFQYRNNISPNVLMVNRTSEDPTSYKFYSSNQTLYVENFSVPSPQNVRGVKFICEFSVISQGRLIRAETATAVIPGFYPPKITRSLDNVTVIPQGSSHTFMVGVYSHPPLRKYLWQLNGTEISASDSRFVMKGPLISGNTSNFSLTILNADEEHSGILQFTARLGNSTNTTQTLVIIPPQVKAVELSNSCGDITHGEGPLRLNVTLSSNLPALNQHHNLRAELQVNFSLIPKIPNTESQGIDSIIDTTDISDAFHSQRTGDRSIQLEVDRAAVPRQVMERIKNGHERFRAQVKLVFNGVTAAEWSPVCESPIFQPCIDITPAEIKLKLKFSSEDQCSRYSAREVKAAIEDLLREKFSCDNITVQSADEYHCHQRNKISILRANVFTYFAKDRVEQFYSYLKTEQISLFDGRVEVSEDNDGVPSQSTHSDYMIYVYVFIVVTVLLFCVIVIFIVITALMVKKSRKKSNPKDPEDKDDNRPGSSASSSRSQNFYVEDRSLSRSPMSPTSITSSMLARTPNHTHNNHTPHNACTPPQSPHSTHTPQDHNSHYPEESAPQAYPCHQVINLEDENTAAIPLHCVQTYLSNQDSHLTSTGAYETTFLSEQEIRSNQQSRAESSAFGDDMSLNDSEHRLRYMDSPAMRSTPSSGYQSRQSSSLSRHHQKAPRQRHNTEGHPVTALVQLPTTAGGGYLVLHGLDLADRQRTSSTSQLRPATVLQAEALNVIQVQPASMSLADMQERTCEMTSPRSREHLRLPLPGGVQLHHTSKELRIVVPCEVVSPHRRLSDPSPLNSSPREFCNLGGRGEEFNRQNTSGAESISSGESIN